MSQTGSLDIFVPDETRTGNKSYSQAIKDISQVISDTLVIDASLYATPYTIPYGPDDQGAKQALRFIALRITGVIGAAWTAYVPARNHLFIAENATTGGFAVTVMVAGQAGVTIPSGERWLCYCDGTDVRPVAGGGGGGGGGGGSTSNGAWGARPAAGNNGNLFFPSDAAVIERDNGSAWKDWGPIFALTPPALGGFTWVNQGGATATQTRSGVVLTAPGHGSGANFRCLVKAAPARPYTITAFLLGMMLSKSFHTVGLLFRESSTGKLHTFNMVGVSGGRVTLASSKLTNPTTFSADYQQLDLQARLRWLRIADDNTNRICSVSEDGQNWVQIHSITRTDFLTGGADQVGFFAGAENQGTPNVSVIANLLSWVEA